MVTLLKRMLSIVLVALSSCNNSDKNSSLIFEELNESLERSNKVIENSTRSLLYDLENKKRKGITAERAFVWYAKADSIKSRTDGLVKFIKQLQLNLGNREGYEKEMSDLKDSLGKYRNFILSFDSVMETRLTKTIPIFTIGIKNETQFDKGTFQAKTTLLKVENDVRVGENMAIAYCNQQTALGCNLTYFMTSAIATSNSTKFGVGEEMIINLGVGEFSLASKPSFFVNNKNVPPNENGIGEYKINVGNKPGKYKVRVKIMHLAPDGRKEEIEKDIEYTVME
jgi:hypothetical protein